MLAPQQGDEDNHPFDHQHQHSHPSSQLANRFSVPHKETDVAEEEAQRQWYPVHDYRNRLRTTVGSSAAPYGYTLAVWTSGAVLTNARGVPDTLAALTFMVGAVVGFALVGVIAFGGVTRHFDRDHGETPLIWGSFHFFSVGLAIGLASLVAYYVDGYMAWPLGSFLSTTTYLLVAGVESATAYWWDHRG